MWRSLHMNFLHVCSNLSISVGLLDFYPVALRKIQWPENVRITTLQFRIPLFIYMFSLFTLHMYLLYAWPNLLNGVNPLIFLKPKFLNSYFIPNHSKGEISEHRRRVPNCSQCLGAIGTSDF